MVIPEYYFCHKCEASNQKLWRWNDTTEIRLWCQECVEVYYGQIDLPGYTVYQMVAAMPLSETSYWNIQNAPAEAFKWWDSLPGYLNSPKETIIFGSLLSDKIFPWFNLKTKGPEYDEYPILHTDTLALHNKAKSFIDKYVRVEGIVYFNKTQNPMAVVARHISLAKQ